MSWHDMANRMLGVAVRTFSAPLVQILPAGGGSPIDLPAAVFDTSHIEVDPETGAPVSTNSPVLGVRISDLPGMPESGDRVQVGGMAFGMEWANGVYSINDVQPDGVSGLLMYLHKV